MDLLSDHPFIFKLLEYGWVVASAIFALVYKPMRDRIKELENSVASLQVHIPITYVTKADLKESIADMKQSNRESLSEIKATVGELKVTFERYTDKVIELLSHE